MCSFLFDDFSLTLIVCYRMNEVLEWEIGFRSELSFRVCSSLKAQIYVVTLVDRKKTVSVSTELALVVR